LAWWGERGWGGGFGVGSGTFPLEFTFPSTRGWCGLLTESYIPNLL